MSVSTCKSFTDENLLHTCPCQSGAGEQTDILIRVFSSSKDLHFEMCLCLQLLAVCSFFTISLHAKVPPFNFDGMDSNSASKERLPSSFQTDH